MNGRIRFLERTKKILDEEGWIQGELRTNEGFCLVGAMDQAGTDLFGCDNEDYLHNASHAMTMVTEHVRELEGDDFSCVEYWNDTDGRKVEEVIDCLDSVIDKYRVEEVIEESKDVEVETPAGVA